MAIHEVTTNIPDLISLEVSAHAGAACATFSFETLSGGYSIGDEISISMGVDGGAGTVLTGNIDTVTLQNPPQSYRIEGRDKLAVALDYFIVVAGLDEGDFFNVCPGSPGNYTLVSPSEAISAILALCGLSGGGGIGTGWLLGTPEEGAPFQLISAWDAIQQICSIGAWKAWCDADGNIQVGSVLDASGYGGAFSTGDEGNIISCSYGLSNEDIRNKIVVIGAPDPENGYYTATASATSPYLPAGVYKTAVISTDLIGSDGMAQATAAANLTAWNRVSEITTVEAEGNPGVSMYSSVSVSEPFTGATGGMVTSFTHRIDSNGYRTRFTAKAV